MATGDDPLALPSEQVAAPPSAAPSQSLAPDGPTAIQADAPTGISGAPIPLPAPPAPLPAPPPNLDALGRRLRFFEVVLVALLLALAFLTASFPVANSDFFLHLATGRLLAQGQYAFGVDPFTYTTEGTYWVNHAWLFDLLLYALYQLPSAGAVLVVLKGLLIAAVAGLMLLSAQRAGQKRWIPLACVFLALVALSPRLMLQPALFSYFFLALTLYLLRSSQQNLRRAWLVPALCVVWVNFDEWFVLGPLAVALYALGRLLDRRFGEQPAEEAPPGVEELRTLGYVFGASVLAGLLNPHFHRAFALPSPLGLFEAARALQNDPQFNGGFISPWEKRYVLPVIGLSAAGLAYYVLVAVGLVSFALTFGAWRWWRVLLWLGFGLLGSVNIRTIPLFAVVAGPITALNFLDLAASRFGRELLLERAWRRWAFLGRGLTVLAALALIVATWPGWLQAEPHRARRVGWGVQPDASLVALTERIKAWQEEGKIERGQRWFNTTPDVGNYFAWYCPEERCFLDYRLPLFGKSAAHYALIRQQLSSVEGPGPADAKGGKELPAWGGPFEQHNVRFVVFHTRDHYQLRSLVTLTRLYVDSDEWEACYGEGRAAVFGWTGPPRKRDRAPFARLALDFDRQAFGPDCVPAPPSGSRPAEPHPWYAELYQAPPAEPLESGSAFLNFTRFQALQGRYELEHRLDFERVMLASLVGMSANQGDSLMNGVPLNGLALARINSTFWQAFHRVPPPPEGAKPTKSDEAFFELFYQPYFRDKEKGPTASLYLAVRAARQALAKSPDEPRPYLVLAQAYARMNHATMEAWRIRQMVRTPQGIAVQEVVPHVGMIRQTQIAYALNQMLQSGPAPEIAQRAHRLLAELYSQSGLFFELQVRHSQEYLKLCKAQRRILDRPQEKFGEEIEQFEKFVKARQTELDDRQNKYELKSANKRALLKAQYALREGLAATAIDVLLSAPVEELEEKQPRGVGRPGVTMLLSLLLATGRLPEAAQALLPTAENADTFNRATFGVHPTLHLPAYEWFMVQYSAGVGDYEQADKSLQELVTKTKRSQQPYAVLARTGAISPRDAFDENGAPRMGTVGDLAALALGNFILSNVPRALHVPTPLDRRLFPRPGLEAPLSEVQNLIAEEASLHTVRAWLALEAGTLGRARQVIADADRLTLIDHGKRGRILLFTPSRPLLDLCRELLDRGEGKGKR